MRKRQEVLFIDNSAKDFDEISASGYFHEYTLMHISDVMLLPVYMAGNKADLIIAEIEDPEFIDPIESLKSVLSNSSGAPVIVLSSIKNASCASRALETGADDYVRKPFDIKELLARVRKVLKRAEKLSSFENKENRKPEADAAGEAAGDKPYILVDIKGYSVMVDGKPVSMSPKEIELLYYLSSNAGRVITRDELLEKVWGFDYFGNTRTVDVHIKRLRDVLSKYMDDCPIKTVWGVGYKYSNEEESL